MRSEAVSEIARCYNPTALVFLSDNRGVVRAFLPDCPWGLCFHDDHVHEVPNTPEARKDLAPIARARAVQLRPIITQFFDSLS